MKKNQTSEIGALQQTISSMTKEQITEVELMRMATDLTLNVLNKFPTYRGMDDGERTLAFAMKTFDSCAGTVIRNYKNNFSSLR